MLVCMLNCAWHWSTMFRPRTVCLHAFLHVYVLACMHIFVYQIGIPTCIHVCCVYIQLRSIHAFFHAFDMQMRWRVSNIYIYIYIYLHVYIYIYIYLHIYMCVCMYIHTYIHTCNTCMSEYIHIYIYTHVHI